MLKSAVLTFFIFLACVNVTKATEGVWTYEKFYEGDVCSSDPVAIVAYLSDTCDVTECGLLEDSYYVFETDCVTSFDIPDGIQEKYYATEDCEGDYILVLWWDPGCHAGIVVQCNSTTFTRAKCADYENTQCDACAAGNVVEKDTCVFDEDWLAYKRISCDDDKKMTGAKIFGFVVLAVIVIGGLAVSVSVALWCFIKKSKKRDYANL